MNRLGKKIIYFTSVLLLLGIYGITLGASLVEIGVGLLFLTIVALYNLEARKNREWKMRSKELQITYLIFIFLLWGTFALVSGISLLQLAVGYLLILFMVLYVRGKENDITEG